MDAFKFEEDLIAPGLREDVSDFEEIEEDLENDSNLRPKHSKRV
mgnify:CR=1 FL=1